MTDWDKPTSFVGYCVKTPAGYEFKVIAARGYSQDTGELQDNAGQWWPLSTLTLVEGGTEQAAAKALRGLIERIAALQRIAQGDAESPQQAVELDLDEFAEPQVLYDEANDSLLEIPLAIERMMQFEIVLGLGGPDERLIVECLRVDGNNPEPEAPATYDIRRILYRYSWQGMAEIELIGDDRAVAEEFARLHIPELSE